MALIALASGAGSPGVTTTALGLAMSWPRNVLLVDADPAGTSAIPAGYFRGETQFAHGLIDLAQSQRNGSLREDLPAVATAISESVSFIPGIRTPTQAPSMHALWEPLARELLDADSRGVDVIVDCGRLTQVGAPAPIFAAADLALLATRSDLPALAGARPWAERLQEEFFARGATANLGLLLIGSGQPYGVREVQSTLGLTVRSTIHWDSENALVYSRGTAPGKKFSTSAITKSFQATASKVNADLAQRRSDLAQEVPTHG